MSGICLSCSFIVANYDFNSVHTKKELEFANYFNRMRGPDATNIEVIESWTFLHNLLSMTGAFTLQPFVSDKKDVIAIFNGEIYNYKEIASQLSLTDEEAKSDGTILLPSYARWGKTFFQHLNGEFAIIIVDFS